MVRLAEDARRAPSSDRRVPPQNLEAEGSVLGSMMLSSEAIAEVVEVLQPQDFYRGANGRIYETLRGEVQVRVVGPHAGGVPYVFDLSSR